MTQHRWIAIAAYILLGVVWGTYFVFMQAADPYITAGQTTLIRLIFGVMPILIFGIITRNISWRHLRYTHHFAVQGVLAAGFYYYAYAEGTYRLDSSIAGAMSGSIPLFASISAIILFRTEGTTWRKTLGLFLGTLGMVIVAQPWNASSIDGSGILWMLAGSASLGISFGYARRFITPLKIPSAAAATYQMLLASVFTALFIDLDGITNIQQNSLALVIVIVGLGIVGTGFAFVFYYTAVNGLGAVTASSATYIPPVVALIIGVGFLHEQFQILVIFGIVLTIAGAVIIQLPQRKSRKTPQRTPEKVTCAA